MTVVNPATLGTLGIFVSAEQTGTGSSQDIAHGLGRVPSIVMFAQTDGAAAGATVAEGTHDATNVKVTVTASRMFKVLAM